MSICKGPESTSTPLSCPNDELLLLGLDQGLCHFQSTESVESSFLPALVAGFFLDLILK
eukprot:CAMPEP_0185901766 /NCGR_PEP_ID=MMETSP0196C-20130402/1099_1 /TAXON_ID=2932 /ORGANISM="Alexandrium fundyense, Strain CCMP1719" /LENGTH=58 /DNA_ID=CAMNT_0028620477 /DNA_START=57 /DNA_END=230 /DNA_ORIENTATION=-